MSHHIEQQLAEVAAKIVQVRADAIDAVFLLTAKQDLLLKALAASIPVDVEVQDILDAAKLEDSKVIPEEILPVE